jgi:hypothetical protein
LKLLSRTGGGEVFGVDEVERDLVVIVGGVNKPSRPLTTRQLDPTLRGGWGLVTMRV